MNFDVSLTGYHWEQEQLDIGLKDGIFYLALNMTSACNYRCPYCFVGLDNLKKSPSELNLEDKIKLLSDAKSCGTKVIVMPGKGEPLFDPDFWDIVAEAERLKLWVVVYTNAYFLDEEKINKLKKLPVSLYIKIDSFDPNVYEEMVGVSDVFSKVMKNLNLLTENFHKLSNNNGRISSNIGINSVVTSQTNSSIQEIYEWCKKREIFFTCRSPVNVGEAAIKWDSLVDSQVGKLRETGRKFAARNFTSATDLGQCGIYRYGITIQNTGDVYVCPDAHEGFDAIGNIKATSLAKLINRRNTLFPPNSTSGYCFVKAHHNPEERE